MNPLMKIRAEEFPPQRPKEAPPVTTTNNQPEAATNAFSDVRVKALEEAIRAEANGRVIAYALNDVIVLIQGGGDSRKVSGLVAALCHRLVPGIGDPRWLPQTPEAKTRKPRADKKSNSCPWCGKVYPLHRSSLRKHFKRCPLRPQEVPADPWVGM